MKVQVDSINTASLLALFIASETGQDVEEDMLFVTEVDEHGNEEIMPPVETLPEITCNRQSNTELKTNSSKFNMFC